MVSKHAESALPGFNGKIVFVSDRDLIGNTLDDEIYAMNADGSGQTRLTNDPGLDNAPVWSPDGTQILFGRGQGTARDLYVMASDGGDVTRVTHGPWAQLAAPADRPIAFSNLYAASNPHANR